MGFEIAAYYRPFAAVNFTSGKVSAIASPAQLDAPAEIHWLCPNGYPLSK